MAPPTAPSSRVRAQPRQEAPKESLVSRLLITPIAFISFLLSLALIDSRNTSARTRQRQPAPVSRLGRITAFFHGLFYKPAPYAYISAPGGRGGAWFWHTKQKQQMKAEIADAFRVRQWVLLVLLGSVAAGVVGLWFVARWVVYLGRSWL